MRNDSGKRFVFFGSILGILGALLVIPTLYWGGIGGCGGGTDAVRGATGVSVDSVSDIPSVNIADYYDTSSGSSSLMSQLKAQTASGTGSSCKEFCYLKQCLLETLRHSKEIEFFLCMSRKAKEATSGLFDFPTSGCKYFEVTPPKISEETGGEKGGSGETGGGGTSGGTPPSLRLKHIEAGDPDEGLIHIRLCSEGETKKFHMCQDSTLHQEIILTNDSSTGGINATATNSFGFGECDDRGQMVISTNCSADNFTSPDCIGNFNAKFNGCFGSGAINFGVTGGTGTAREYTLDANFDQGGEGEGTFGSSSVCTFGHWAAGANGCFKADSQGSFPAIPVAEASFVSNIPGCEDAAAATSLCPNDNFDPQNFDPAVPVCPFSVATSDSCPFDFTDVACCSITGTSISDQTGTRISDTDGGALFTEATNHTCPENASDISYVDEWDCSAVGSFTPLDLSTSSVDFSECTAIFQDLQSVSAEANCEEQDADEESQNVQQDFQSNECTANTDCTSGQICSQVDPSDTKKFCIDPPTSCTSDTDCASACAEGQTCTCQFLPSSGSNGCAPTFSCTSDDECPPGATCNTSTSLCAFSQKKSGGGGTGPGPGSGPGSGPPKSK